VVEFKNGTSRCLRDDQAKNCTATPTSGLFIDRASAAVQAVKLIGRSSRRADALPTSGDEAGQVLSTKEKLMESLYREISFQDSLSGQAHTKCE